MLFGARSEGWVKAVAGYVQERRLQEALHKGGDVQRAYVLNAGKARAPGQRMMGRIAEDFK